MSSSSRLPGFYRLSVSGRRELLAELRRLNPETLGALDTGGIDLQIADGMVENVVGLYSLPLGLAINFRIDERDVVVPMVVEEPSVIAAASNAAKMVRAGGGFRTEVSAPVMIGQVQLCDVADPRAAVAAVEGAREEILARGRRIVPSLVSRGGGPLDVEARVLSEPGSPDGGMIVVHLLVDCRDAMGANTVNAIAEGVADELARLAGARAGLRILSNLSVRRMVRVSATVPDDALCDQRGAEVRTAVAEASRFAVLDPYRAVTHNKGIMNGVDAVLVATANDWRGVEAGAHAYACREGRYQPLALWHDRDGQLFGELEMPLAVGTVGGALQAHAGARLALDILGIDSAQELAGVAGAAGLATNLAALRALATDGIQRGHMPLHQRKKEIVSAMEDPT